MEGRGQSARVVLLSRGLRACGVHGAEHEATSWMPSPSALRIQHSLLVHVQSYTLYTIHTVFKAERCMLVSWWCDAWAKRNAA